MNEVSKDYLNKGKDYLRSIRKAYENEAEYRETISSAKAQMISDMPHAQGKTSDLSNQIVRIDYIVASRREEIEEYMEQLKDTIDNLLQMNDMDDALLLLQKYIFDMSLEEIAGQRYYPVSTLKRKNYNALEEFSKTIDSELPKC